MVNGVNFDVDPSDVTLINIAFDSVEDNRIPVGEADITATVDITDVDLTGCYT